MLSNDKSKLAIVAIVGMFLGFLVFALIVYVKSSQASTTPLRRTLTPEQIRRGQEFLELLNTGEK